MDAVVIRSSTGRAFGAGGDIGYFYDVGTRTSRGGSASLEDLLTEEYAFNHLMHHFPKPYIALMVGVVMGGAWDSRRRIRSPGRALSRHARKWRCPRSILACFPRSAPVTSCRAHMEGPAGSWH